MAVGNFYYGVPAAVEPLVFVGLVVPVIDYPECFETDYSMELEPVVVAGTDSIESFVVVSAEARTD